MLRETRFLKGLLAGLFLMLAVGGCGTGAEAQIAATNTPMNTATHTPAPTGTATLTPTFSQVDEHSCIQSFEALAYSVPDEELEAMILSGTSWMIESTVPGNGWFTYVAASREIDGQTEVWVRRKDTMASLPLGDTIREIQIYNTQTQEWKQISAEIGGTGVFVDQLFVTSDGSVWGRNIWNPIEKLDLNRVPVLSKYNAVSQRFEFDHDGLIIPIVQETVNYFDFSLVLLDSEGVFWAFVQYDGLYRYDPITHEGVLRVEIPDIQVTKAAMAPDGSIYFGQEFIDAQLQEEELFHFIPKADQIALVDIPSEPWPSFSNILVDHNNNLWLDAVGWLEPDGTWHLMYPNPEDFFENIYNDQRWGSLKVLLESSDGVLWFSKYTLSHNGSAWFDPNTGEGCWLTTEYGNIIEDLDRNLWFVADGKLYKYALTP